MKKSIVLFALMATTGLGAFAQQATTTSYFDNDKMKPSQGKVTTEFGLTGGILNSDFNLNDGAGTLLKFRYFLDDQLALRLGANIGINNQTENFYTTLNSTEGYLKTVNSAVLINLGIEKHFDGTRRLSPFVGADILFGMSAQSRKTENSDGNRYVNNLMITETGPGSFGMGIRGVVGADYYIVKHVFIGVEAGLGLMYAKAGETKTTTTLNNTTTQFTRKSEGSNFNLGANMITGVRIGFVF